MVASKSLLTGGWGMKNFLMLGILVFCAGAQAQTILVDRDTDRVKTILFLDIDGAFYNVHFDQAAGGNVFIGDIAGADSAIDAINAVLNTGDTKPTVAHPDFAGVDNGHPDLTPIYYVMTDLPTTTVYGGCYAFVSQCNSEWAPLGAPASGITNLDPVAYFMPVNQPTVELNEENGRVKSILGLTIGNALYNVHFKQSAGTNVFAGLGPYPAADAVDVINAVLEEGGYHAIDNGHPEVFPTYYVMASYETFTGSGGCRSSYGGDSCKNGWGAIAIDGVETSPWTFFERIDALQVEIDVVDGPFPYRKVHPHHDGPTAIAGLNDSIHVVVLGSSTGVGDSVDLDTNLIDPMTLRFSHSRATVDPGSTPQFNYNDDDDGLDDAKFEFLTGDTSIGCTDTEVQIEGELATGQAFTATDSDFNSDCNAGCHPD
jgi:hypothetical protein